MGTTPTSQVAPLRLGDQLPSLLRDLAAKRVIPKGDQPALNRTVFETFVPSALQEFARCVLARVVASVLLLRSEQDETDGTRFLIEAADVLHTLLREDGKGRLLEIVAGHQATTAAHICVALAIFVREEALKGSEPLLRWDKTGLRLTWDRRATAAYQWPPRVQLSPESLGD